MACQINRTKDGKINEVTTPTGAKSKLFEAIHSNVFLADAETSVKVYNNAYSEKVEKMFEGATTNKYDTGEPQLFYKSPSNKVYDNLTDVLINEELGEISMGFLNPKNEEFIPVAKFTNKGSTKNEFLASKVREGLLSASRVLGVDGVTRFQGKGEYTSTRKTTALFVQTDIKAETGNGRIKVLDDGTIEIEFAKDYSEAIDDNGNSTPIKTENIPEYLEKNPNVENKVELITEYVMKYDNPQSIDKDTSKSKTKTITDLSGIEKSLMEFLGSLGFSTTSLEEYRANYNTKYGEGRDIGALADIANKVIAFRNGEISAEDLSEEVAHVAIEAYADQNSIATALANVHLTPEYTDLAEKYRNRYSNDKNKDGSKLTPIELEDKVRKEILGKLLKKELITRFSTQNRTNEDIYLIKKLKAIWESFMNMISTHFKPYHTTLLDELNDKIADSILNKNSEDFLEELLDENQNYFYSLMDNKGKAIYTELEIARGHIEKLFNTYLKEPSPSLVELEDMTDTMSDYKVVSSANTIVSIASKQMNSLLDATKSRKSEERLSTKDVNRYEQLKNNLIPAVNNLMSELNKSASKGEIVEKRLLNDIAMLNAAKAKLAVDMTVVEPTINSGKLAWVDSMLMKILNYTTLTEEQKEDIRSNLDGGMRDIGFLAKMFGLSSHSKNIALQLMHYSVLNISVKTNKKFLSRANEILSDMVMKNGLKYQVGIIAEDANGKKGMHLWSPRDYEGDDTMMLNKKIEIVAIKSGKLFEEVEKAIKKGLKAPQDYLDAKQLQEMKDELSDYANKVVREQRMLPIYYEERDARFDKAKVSPETRKYLAKKNSQMNFRHKEGGHIRPDGTKDLSKQTDYEKLQDQEDKQNHKRVSAAHDQLGNLKAGIKSVSVSDLTAEEIASIPVEINPEYKGNVIILDGTISLEELEKNYPQSRRALDIFNHNMEYSNEISKQDRDSSPIPKFFEEIQDIEDANELAYDWLISNSTLSISSNFYEGTSDNETRDDITQRYIDDLTDAREKDKHQVIFDELKELKRIKSDLLRQNKKAYSSVEYDAKHMTDQVRAKERELEDEIYRKTRALNIPYETYEKSEESNTQQELNEDYELMFAESSLSEYEFALTHSPKYKEERVRTFSRVIEDYIYKRTNKIMPYHSAFVERITEEGLLDDESLDDDAILEILKTEFAKENVASYFKRFTPKGYSEALDALKTGKVSISEFLEDKEQFIEEYPALEYMEFTPDYTWRSEVTNDKNLNPEFKPGDNFIQPKALNEGFFKRYFINPEKGKKAYRALRTEDLNLLTPTKNIEEYEHLKANIEINKEIIENYGRTGKANPYQRVQMKKSDFERALSLYKSKDKKGALKDWIGDISKSQVDEMEYGQQIEGSDITIKQVPMYYQQRVEDAGLLTENTTQASLTALRASIKYKERLLAEQDVNAILYKIKEQKFKSSGGNSVRTRIQKKSEVSNYEAKAQEMADAQLYGIRQNRKMITTVFGKEIDFTQLLTRFTDYVRNVNLAYNPLVDLTSYTTGVYNNLIDTIAGDYYHKSSVSVASTRLPNLIRLYMAEEGNIRKTSELNHILEWLNVFSEDERLQMSAYNKGVRLASNSLYLGAKLANLPVTPRNTLAILYDHKFHNGRFKSYNEFARDMKVELGKDTKSSEIGARWKKNTDTFYSNLNIDPSKGITMGENFKAKFGEKAEEEFEMYQTKLTAKIAQVNQSVDSIISSEDQIMAQRDALTNALLMHRGWFIINMTRKWKGKHFNLSTGQYESGHYQSAYGSGKKLVKNVLNKQERQKVREVLDEHEMRNLIRAGVDVLGVLLLIALSNALMDDDDEDDSYFEDLAQLIVLRTTNETQSQHIIGTYGTIKDIYKEPLVQRRLVNDAITGVAAGIGYPLGLSEDKDKYDKFWKQNIIGRRKYQLEDMQRQVDSYLHFHEETLWWVDAADKKKRKEQQENNK